jgi:hypothetical protein
MRRIAVTIGFAAIAIAAALACGPFFVDLITVNHDRPADLPAYSRGELDVIKPTFARRYLVDAYRTINGVGPLPPAAVSPRVAGSGFDRWEAIQKRTLPAATQASLRPIATERRSPDFSSFENCLDPAFAAAAAAFDERTQRYGAGSAEVNDWVAGQSAVFQNCGGGALVLPAETYLDADARLKADRDYQIAAAYFYATQYDEAAGRFRAIAGNGISPWRASGRYLAARSLIRSVTVPRVVKDAPQRLAAAERDLQATLADREAAALHASARGLLDFIAIRARPLDRLHELSRRLATGVAVAPQEVLDYTWLMDVALGENAGGTTPLDLADVTRDDELTTWIIDTQRRRTDAAIERWKETRTTTALVAALWSAPPLHADLPMLLTAAAAVPKASPAFVTVSFLRVRGLIQRGDVDGARAALASLPDRPGSGVGPEASNLFRAERFAVASSLDELLAAAPRDIVTAPAAFAIGGATPPKFDQPTWDDDVAAVFNGRLPLDLLVTAAESARLPARLRIRVAQSAFTRAVLLRRAEPGRRAATVLRTLAPPLGSDLARYLTAADDDARARAGVLTLLRTPGLSINVAGRDDDASYRRVEPRRTFGHAFPRNWWCGVQDDVGQGAASLVTGPGRPPFPAFVMEPEQVATARELEALQAIGEPRAYLITAAIEWGRTRRSDPVAAEALALAIEGWRWSPCASTSTVKPDLPRQAFTLLHRQFPDSEWARRTKYWYD